MESVDTCRNARTAPRNSLSSRQSQPASSRNTRNFSEIIARSQSVIKTQDWTGRRDKLVRTLCSSWRQSISSEPDLPDHTSNTKVVLNANSNSQDEYDMVAKAPSLRNIFREVVIVFH